MQFVRQNPSLGGGIYGWANCMAASGAMLVDIESGGSKTPTAAEFRAQCLEPDGRRDTTGGLMPSQVIAAARRFGIALDGTVLPFEEAWRLGARSDVALQVSISYSAVSPTKFDGSPGFYGNHAVVLHRGMVYDPLADGRKPGIPNGPQKWPKDLLRRAAGRYANLGAGRAAVIIGRAPAVRPTRYSVAFEKGAIWLYDQNQSRVRFEFGQDTSAPCSAPFNIPWSSGTKRVVQVTAGILKARLVEPGATHVTLKARV